MNSKVVLFRLSIAERQHLETIAKQRGETLSEVVRDALYASYRLGSLSACSLTVSPSLPNCNTPRT
jgi:hypothetical protein